MEEEEWESMGFLQVTPVSQLELWVHVVTGLLTSHSSHFAYSMIIQQLQVANQYSQYLVAPSQTEGQEA